jgi:hypothetical protein
MNNAKEKAKELVALFEYEDNLGIAENTGIEGIDENQAKKCAIKAVDEFLKIENIKPYILHKVIIEFYQEVKKEIEKI